MNALEVLTLLLVVFSALCKALHNAANAKGYEMLGNARLDEILSKLPTGWRMA